MRALAAQRRASDLHQGDPGRCGLARAIDTPSSRRWFDDFTQARTPAQAAQAVIDLALSERVDPAAYGELVRFGTVLPWRDGTPARYQDRPPTQ